MKINSKFKLLITSLWLSLPAMAEGGFGDDFGSNSQPTEVKDYGYNFHEQDNITPDIQTLTTDLFGDKIDPSFLKI